MADINKTGGEDQKAALDKLTQEIAVLTAAVQKLEQAHATPPATGGGSQSASTSETSSGKNGELTTPPSKDAGTGGETPRFQLVSQANEGYVIAAAQVAVTMMASPELQKGPARFLAFAPAIASLADRNLDKKHLEGALAPAALGAIGMFVPRLLK
jgi:hypothetical protein